MAQWWLKGGSNLVGGGHWSGGSDQGIECVGGFLAEVDVYLAMELWGGGGEGNILCNMGEE